MKRSALKKLSAYKPTGLKSASASVTSTSKLVKIGEAAKLLGISIDTLRRWEKRGWLNVTKTPGGTRLYDKDQLSKLNPNLRKGPKSLLTPFAPTQPQVSFSKTESYLLHTNTGTQPRIHLNSDQPILKISESIKPSQIESDMVDSFSRIEKSIVSHTPSFKLNSKTLESIKNNIQLAVITLILIFPLVLLAGYISSRPSVVGGFSQILQPISRNQFISSKDLIKQLAEIFSPTLSHGLFGKYPIASPPGFNAKLNNKNQDQLASGRVSGDLKGSSFSRSKGQVLADSTPSGSFLQINLDTQINGSLSVDTATVSGALYSSTINTGFGDNEVYPMNQPLLTTSPVTFATLTAGSLSGGTLSLTSGSNQLTLANTIISTQTGGSGAFTVSIPALTSNGNFVIDNAVQTLTNKTISGSSNTFESIPNSALSSSSITINAGSGLSGGGEVSLGGSITLTATGGSSSGVSSITGTADQIIASASTGDITLSLPQSIATTSSPEFANLTLSDLDNHGVVYTTGAGLLDTVTTASTGECLLSNGSAAPTWGSCFSGSTSFTLAGDSGPNQSISSGDTLTINGDSNIATLGVDTDHFSITLASALTGITSIDTIAVSSTVLTFAGAGTISSTTSSAITLDSGTTGTVNLGTGNNAKTINLGTGNAGNTINIGTDNTIADAINIGSALDTTIITGTTRLAGLTTNGPIYTSGGNGTLNSEAQLAVSRGGTGQDFSSIAQGSLPYFSATGTFSALAPSTAGYVLTTQGAGADPTWTDTGSLTVRWNTIDDPNGNQTLAMADYTTNWNWATADTETAFSATANALTSGTLFNLSSTSTAGAGSGNSFLLDLSRSGTNSNASHTAYGVRSQVTNTGTTSTNIAGYFSASGASTNYALYAPVGNMYLADALGIGTGSVGTYKVDFGTGAYSRTLNVTNTSASGTAYGAYINKSGAATTGVALDLTSSGATNNYALQTDAMTAGSGGSTFHLNLGTTAGASSATFGAINTGAISGAGTTSYGLNLGANSSTATTNYGVNIGSITGAGTTNYGLAIGTISGAASNYAIYAPSGYSYFGGSFGIGSDAPSQTSKLAVVTTGLATTLDVTNNNTGSTAYGTRITKSGAATTGVGLYVTSSGATNNYAAIFDAGRVGIGDTTPDSLFDFEGAISGTPSSTGAWLNYTGSTFTDSATSGSGTATTFAANAFGQPTLAATNSNVTTTNAATVYIANAPATGSNQTITAPLALLVDSGAARFDGHVGIGSGYNNAAVSSTSVLGISEAYTGSSSFRHVNLFGSHAPSSDNSNTQYAFASVLDLHSSATASLTGTVTAGLFQITNSNATQSIGTAFGSWIGTATSSGGAITNNYGLFIDDQTVGSSDYGLRIDAADTQTLWVGGGADGTTASAGIAFGSSRDTNLYRSAADTLKTDDAFTATGLITGSTGLTITGGTASINASGSSSTTIGNTSSDLTLTGNHINASMTLTDTSSGAKNGLSSTISLNPSGSSASQFRANSFSATVSSGNVQDFTDVIRGVYAETRHLGTGSINIATGVFSAGVVLPTAATSFGTITEINAFHALPVSEFASSAITGTVSTARGIYIENSAKANSSWAMTTQVGIDVSAMTSGSSDIGVRIAGADTYSLQLSSTAGTAASGITFGTDTNLYRSAADTLKTDDAFNVNGNLNITSAGAISAATGITSSGTITFSGLSADSGVYTTTGGQLTTTPPSSGTLGYWSRTGSTLSPANSGDAITTSGNISTTGTGTISSAGLLSGTAGLTITGATASLNASSNFNTNINTGTSTGAISIGNSSAGAIALSTGSTFGITTTTGAQTFTSANLTGTTTSSSYVFNASSLTSGTALYITSSATSGKTVDINASQTSGTIFNLAYGSAKTISGDLTGLSVDLNSGNVDATNQNITGVNFKIPTVTDTHTSGTKTLTGMLVNFGSGAGINQNGAGGTLEYIAGDFQLPALTQTAGTLNAYGTKVTTPATITTGGTAYGNYVSATGVGAGTLSGLGVSSITGGAGTEYALNIGSGWDAVLRVGSTTVINGSGVTVEAGGGTGQSTYSTGDILYASGANTLAKRTIGNSNEVLTVVGGVPTWATISGSSCSNCVITDPTSDQTIAPTGQGTTGLTVRQTSTASPTDDIFQITSSDGATKYFYVDKDGNVSTSGTSGQTLTLTPLTDTTALTLVGTNVTSQPLQYVNSKNSSATSGIINMAYGAAQTLTGSVIGIRTDLSTNVTATNQSVTGYQITLPGATNTSGTQAYKGIVISGGSINENGGTATTFTGADITIPALTQTSGTLTGYGANITTPSSITTGGTAYGVNIAATGVGAGSLYGVNISDITAGAGTEVGMQIGSGWDTNLLFNDTSTRVAIADGGSLTILDSAGNSLCTLTDTGSAGNLSCTGTIGGSGTVGFWSKSSTTISPATANDVVSISSNDTSNAVLALTSTGAASSPFTMTANSVTTGTILSLAGTGLTTGEILDITGTWAPTDGSTNEGIDLNFTHAPTTSADVFSAIDLDITDATTLNNTVYGLNTSIALSSNAQRTAYGVYSDLSTSGTSGDILYGGYFNAQGGSSSQGTAYGIWAQAGVANTVEVIHAEIDSNMDTGLKIGNTGSSLAQASVQGVYVDLSGNTSSNSGSSAINRTGFQVSQAAASISSGSNNSTYRGFYQSAASALTTSSSYSGTVSSYGVDLVLPNITQGAGTINAYGLNVANGTITTDGTQYGVNVTTSSITTAGTQYGLNVAASGVGAGSLYGLNISDITGGAGTEIGAQIGSGWDTNLLFNDTTTRVGVADTGTINIIDSAGNSLCSITDNANVGDLTCTGNITGGSTGTVGYWSRSSTTLSPATVNDVVSISSNDTSNAVLALTSTGAASSPFTMTANSVTTGTALSLSTTGMTTGEAFDITGTWAPTNGSSNEAIDINITHTPTTSADTFRGVDLTLTDGTALGNTIYNFYSNQTLTGNAAKEAYAYYGTLSSSSTTGDSITGIRLVTSATGAMTTGTRTHYGVLSQPASTAASTGGTLNLYGGRFTPSSTLSNPGATDTATNNIYGIYASTTATLAADCTSNCTTNQYGLYVDNGTSDTDGTSAKYGIYINTQSGADTNYALYSAASANSYFAGNLGIGDTTPTEATLVVAGTLQLTGSLGNITTSSSGNNIDMSRAGANYITATNAAGTLFFGAGGTNGTLYVNSNGNTHVAANYNLTLDSGTGRYIQTFAGTTTDPFAITANSLTTGNLINLTATGMTSGEVLNIDSTYSPADGSNNEAIDINLTNSPTVSANTLRGIDLTVTDSTALDNVIYGYRTTLTMTGNAAKIGRAVEGNVTSSSTTADALNAGYFTTTATGNAARNNNIALTGLANSSSTTADNLIGVQGSTSATGILTSGTRNNYGLVSQPASTAASTGGTNNTFGVYLNPSSTLSNPGVSDTATNNVYGAVITTVATIAADCTTNCTTNQYGILINDGTSSTNGTSTKYGLYIAAQTGADTNVGGYFGSSVGINDTTPDAWLDIDGATTTTASFGITDTGVHTGTTTSSVAHITANGTTTGTVLHLSATGMTSGTILNTTGTWTPTAGGIVNGVGIAATYNPNTTAGTFRGMTSSITDTSTLASTTSIAGLFFNNSTGNAASKSIYGAQGTAWSSSTTADTTYGLLGSTSITGIITTGTRASYGVMGAPASTAASTGGTMHMYGGYFAPSSTLSNPGVSDTAGNNVYGVYTAPVLTVAADCTTNCTSTQYGLYVANGTSSTNGTSTKYGIYIANQTGADTNYHLYVSSLSTATSGVNQNGGYFAYTVNPGSATAATTYYDNIVSTISTSANAIDHTNSVVRGGVFVPTHAGSGTLGTLVGAQAPIYNTSSGTVTTAQGFSSSLTQNTGTISNYFGYSASINSNAGTITNAYGFYAGDLTTGTQTNTPWSFYASDTSARNYFAGNTGIGSDNTPDALLEVGNGTDEFQVNSSGAIAAATGITSSGTINFSGLSASSAVYTDSSKNLTSTPPSSGTIGYWSRSSTTLSPATAGDVVLLDNNTAYQMKDTGGVARSLVLLNSSDMQTFGVGAYNATYNGYRVDITSALPLGQTTDSAFDIKSSSDLGSSDELVQFGDSAGDFLTILGGGNVGIGDSSPAAMFTVGSSDAFQINSSGNIANIGGAAHTIANSSGALGIDSATTGAINIGTSANAKTITVGNSTGATALAFTSGTGSQTFTSSVATTSTTSSAFVFTANSLTSGTGAYLNSTSLTTGKLFQLSTGAANTLTSGTLADMRTTSTALTGSTGTGSLLNLDWSPGSSTTATGDLFALNIGTNGTTTGKLFNILDASSSIFSVSETSFTTSLPSNFTAAGDTSIAYDINFTNPTASYIESIAPLYVVAGETFNSSNLNLQTYNFGSVVVDSALTTGTGTKYNFQSTLSDATANANFLYGVYSTVNNSSNTSSGTHSIYGGYFSATSKTTGTTTAIGVYGTASGGDNNFPFYSGVAFPTANTAGLCWDNSGESAIYDCNGTPTDLAENYGTSDSSIEAGDVVAFTGEAQEVLDPREGKVTTKAFVKKSNSQYQNDLVGIVSTNPNQTYGEDGLFSLAENPRPVSLTGRVPVKVSTENGPIAAGDYLTSSSTPGVAMKSTQPGVTIGRALSSYTGSGVGKVIVYVKTGFADPNEALANLLIGNNGQLLGSELNLQKITVATTGTFGGIVRADNYKLNADHINRVGVLASLPVDSQNRANVSDTLNLLAQAANDQESRIADLQSKEASTAAALADAKVLGEQALTQTSSLQDSVASTSATIANLSSQIEELFASITGNSTPSEATPSDQLALTPPTVMFASDSATLDTLTVNSQATVSGQLTAYDGIFQNSLKSLGDTFLGKTNIAGDLSVDGTFSVTEGNTINALPIIYFQTSPLAEAVDFFNGLVTITKDGALATKEIITEQISVKADSSAGQVVLPAGDTEIPVLNELTEGDSIIILTSETTGAPTLAVSDKVEGVGFVVKLGASHTEDIKFSYLIVGQK